MVNADDLQKPRWESVHFVSNNELEKLQSSLKDHPSIVVTCDIHGFTQKATLLSKLAHEMRFPSYFSANWDALNDCLTDRYPSNHDGLILILSNAQELWVKAPLTVGSLVGIWLTAAEFLSKEGIPLHLVFNVDQVDE